MSLTETTINTDTVQRLGTSPFTQRIDCPGAAGWKIADDAADAIARGEKVVSLCLGDTSFDTPEFITQTAIDSLRNGRTHYAPVPGITELRSAIATAQNKIDGNSHSAENVIVFAGAQNALFATMMCLAGPDDEVIVFEPWYATYEACATAGGAEIKAITLGDDGEGAPIIDEEKLRSSITSKTKVILLNSPNNPGGYVFGRQDLESIARVALEHNIWVVSDEVYRDMMFDNEFLSITSLPGMLEQTIIVNSLSKSHAMTGWRIGWTIAPAKVTKHLENTAQCMLFGSPTFIQDAAASALSTRGDVYVEEFREALHRRRDIVVTMMQEMPELHFCQPGGGMFAFINVSELGLSGEEFAQRLFDEFKVAIVPGIAFGPRMKQFIRVSFSGADEVIVDGFKSIQSFVQKRRRELGK